MRHSIPTIIITAIAIIAILVLAYLFFYYSIKPIPWANEIESSAGGNSGTAQIISTDVIIFTIPEVLPEDKKSGNCWVNSIAQPYRQDAWRCMVESEIYDPCFITAEKGIVFCQMNPQKPESFLIELTAALPTPELPKNIQTNWAWFLALEDGTYCSPFTGTRPFFGNPPDVQVAYYGCNSENENERIVLMGDLTEGDVWTANKTILEKKDGVNWTIKSSEQAKAKTVWQ